jgi:hypothetical protein
MEEDMPPKPQTVLELSTAILAFARSQCDSWQAISTALNIASQANCEERQARALQ